MQLEQIDHIAVTCRAPDVSKDWYIRVLGFEHVHAGLWGGTPIFLQLGSTYLALFPAQDATLQQSSNAPRLEHFALRAATQSDFQPMSKLDAELSARPIYQDLVSAAK